MLITNFASGELSKTLFGRTDLDRYYSGAARLENFDVIPTGGVRRRSGTRRLLELEEGAGRLIPFLADRDLGFLLYLTPFKITVYRIREGVIRKQNPPYAGGYAAGEIGGVQRAQNFDTMVLCHENRPPLEVKLIKNNEEEELEIGPLFYSFRKTVAAGTGTTAEDFDGSANDETYENGRLAGDKNYPAAACFYNGRLVFAATAAERQRLFFSAVKTDGETYNFATKKVFLAEKREYVVIDECRIDPNTDRIEMLAPGEFGKFRKKLTEYYVQSPFFDEGVKLIGISGNALITGAGPKGLQVSGEGLSLFLEWKRITESVTGGFWSGAYLFREYIGRSVRPERSFLQFTNGKFRRFTLYFEDIPDNISEEDAPSMPLENPKNCVEDRNFLYNFVYETIGRPAHSYPWAFYDETFNRFINDFHAYIQDKMRFSCVIEGVEQTFYGTPEQIYAQLLGGVSGVAETPVSFYAREIIADEYPTPDCGFTFEIASDSNDAIRWLAVNKGLIAGTETGEWIIPPDAHATNIRAERGSRYGSDKIQGTAVGDATVFFQSGKKSLVEYYIPRQDSSFRAENMAMLSPEMLGEAEAAELDYASSPHTKLLITRGDGTMASLLYERATGTFAWGRITTGGEIKSAAVLPGAGGVDGAYLLVKRGGSFYLELLSEGGSVYLDCWQEAGKNAAAWNAARALYTGGRAAACRVYRDGNGAERYEALDAGAAPDFAKGGDFYIGYAYKSVLRTMPVPGGSAAKKQNIVNLVLRFLESYAVKTASVAAGRARGGSVIRNFEPPFTGIKTAPFPGTWDEEAQAELSAEDPAPAAILSLYAELSEPAGG